MASWIRIEANTDRQRLLPLFDALARQLPPDPDGSLERAFTAWFNQVFARRLAPGDNPPQFRNLKEARTMLEQTVDGWKRQWKREGIREGIREGLGQGRRALLERQLIRRFGAPLPSWVRPRLAAAGIEQLDRWAEEIFDAPTLEALLGAG